jgi:ergothioneine biosynthesis protein EgtB
MPDASPVKWHLAHTTWFFERFVLAPLGIPAVNPAYDYLFNSYYESVGARHPRDKRGVLTRPTTDEVLAYRRAVDARLADLRSSPRPGLPALADALELGRQHEEQHQELLVTDVVHLFSENPLFPAFRSDKPATFERTDLAWRSIQGGVVAIGHEGDGFSFDNERPRHRAHVAPFAIASRLVTCGEYRAFVEDGGYDRPELWLADGFAWRANRRRPIYWHTDGDVFGPHGKSPFDANAPVTNVTYYEADAYARWAGARLPTEGEWEIAESAGAIDQAFGHAWQWTSSAYAPYPGFRALEGAFGEYNGKFMVNQLVLRGSSSATPNGHERATYRNFFPAHAAWQVTGIRLARDA